MKKQHSRIGLLASLAIHGALIGGGFAWLDNHQIEKAAEENALSMEMVAALLEQPPVAVAPETEPEEEVKEPEQNEPEPEPEPKPDAIPDPSLKPKKEPKKEKPKEEKRKEKPKPEKPKVEKKKEEKKKERPKVEPKPIKALEKGPEPKQGIIAKAVPNAAQGEKVVAGVAGGQKNGSVHSTSTTGSVSGGNASELAAYKTALQRALQRRANNSYPQREKMMRKTGTVTIKFTLTPSGAISNVSVINSSGNSNLDNAAVRSAQAVSMPPPPAGFPPSVTVPIKFSLE